MTRKLLYGVLSLALIAFLIFESAKYGWAAGLTVLIFLILPDLALIGGFAEPGRLNPRAVPVYNVLHSYWIPVALIAISFLPLPELWLRSGLEVFLAGVAWATHITVDRTVGYGFRGADGWQSKRRVFA